MLSIIISLILLFSPQVYKKKQASTLAEKGYELIRETKYKNAVDIFNDAIKQDKNCKEAHLGKGIAYYKSGDYNPRNIFPEEFIKRAIKIDPEYLEAKIHLGWAYYYKDQHDHAVEYMAKLLKDEELSAELCFRTAEFYDLIENYYYRTHKMRISHLLKQAVTLGSENPECYYFTGWKYFLKDSIEYSLELYQKGFKLESGEIPCRTAIDLGIIYYNMNNLEKSDEFFSKAISLLPEPQEILFDKILPDDPQKIRKFVLTGLAIKYYTDTYNKLTPEGEDYLENGIFIYDKHSIEEKAFLCLLTNNEKKSYEKLDKNTEKQKFIKTYFLTRDITPFDKINEMEEKFKERREYVIQAYRARTPEGFDDRGKIYLRYGEPNNKYIDHGMANTTDFNESTSGINLNNRYGNRRNDFAGGSNTAIELNKVNVYTESWSYSTIDFDLYFDFMSKDFGGNFEIVPDLVESVPRRGKNTDPTRHAYTVASAYEQRSHLGGIYAYLPLRIRNSVVPEAVMAVETAEYTVRKESIIKKIPLFFPPKTDEKYLPFSFRYASFRADRARAISEIYYGLNLDKINFEKENDIYRSSIVFYYTFIDNDAGKVLTDSISFTFSSSTDNKDGIAINQIRNILEPGEYSIVVQMRNPEGKKLGVLSEKIQVDDFSEKDLKISDIQFSFGIRDAAPGDKYVKNSLKVTPYPFYEVSRTNPIFLYYEIYNLTPNNTGKTQFEIEYDVKLVQQKRSVIEQFLSIAGKQKESISMINRETGSMPNTFNYTSLDLSSLKLGKYDLKVKIHDTVSGKTTEKSIPFILIK
ncbi:GWxTD domain-containing protein [candidate division KSB1 bacterium]